MQCCCCCCCYFYCHSGRHSIIRIFYMSVRYDFITNYTKYANDTGCHDIRHNDLNCSNTRTFEPSGYWLYIGICVYQWKYKAQPEFYKCAFLFHIKNYYYEMFLKFDLIRSTTLNHLNMKISFVTHHLQFFHVVLDVRLSPTTRYVFTHTQTIFIFK